ncbi:MAG: hypothetical protein PHV23_04305 [Candidatus Gracilibacteria bacterium]|nr:hypothetical protein [Candidatus Gracilibacteria bacterium]
MALTVGTLVTEVDEHLQISNLNNNEQGEYVASVKKTIADIVGEKMNNNNAIVTDEEITEINHKIGELKKPVSDVVNEFLFYLQLILRIEEKQEENA